MTMPDINAMDYAFIQNNDMVIGEWISGFVLGIFISSVIWFLVFCNLRLDKGNDLNSELCH